MGIEIIGLLIFNQLFRLSELLLENAGILFFTSGFLVVWVFLTLAAVRRWRSE
jgi:hypothetical protein